MTSPAYVELNSSPANRLSLWDAFLEFIGDRKKKLREWEGNPPHRLGVYVFLVVVLELVLSHRLGHHMGRDPDVIFQFIRVALFIPAIEGLLIFTAHRFAGLFGKQGKPLTVLTFFNLNLAPLLLILPVTLAIRAAGLPDEARVFLLVLLALKVLMNWKDVIEMSYLLTRLQSALIMGFLGFFVWLLVPIVMFMGFAEAVKDWVENLN